MDYLGQRRRTHQARGCLLAMKSWRGIRGWGLFLVKCFSGLPVTPEVLSSRSYERCLETTDKESISDEAASLFIQGQFSQEGGEVRVRAAEGALGLDYNNLHVFGLCMGANLGREKRKGHWGQCRIFPPVSCTINHHSSSSFVFVL